MLAIAEKVASATIIVGLVLKKAKIQENMAQNGQGVAATNNSLPLVFSSESLFCSFFLNLGREDSILLASRLKIRPRRRGENFIHLPFDKSKEIEQVRFFTSRIR